MPDNEAIYTNLPYRIIPHPKKPDRSAFMIIDGPYDGAVFEIASLKFPDKFPEDENESVTVSYHYNVISNETDKTLEGDVKFETLVGEIALSAVHHAIEVSGGENFLTNLEEE